MTTLKLKKFDISNSIKHDRIVVLLGKKEGQENLS